MWRSCAEVPRIASVLAAELDALLFVPLGNPPLGRQSAELGRSAGRLGVGATVGVAGPGTVIR